MGGLLVLVTIAVYWPATGYHFTNLDDPEYVTSNVHVQGGLTVASVEWACLNPVCCNWHPLTLWSHMLDCQLFGLNPWGHHLTNVVLHALNAALVFALLQLMTGATWRSLVVAALFSLHPLRVESVAWVAERKDVLSGFFGLLALIAYARYAQGQSPESKVQRPKAGVQSPQTEGAARSAVPGSMFDVRPSARRFWYWTAVGMFALGLMSKPMLVTWPFVMLLLDYWPLRRFEPSAVNSQRATILRLVGEKLPFFALAALESAATLLVQRGAMTGVESLPLGARFQNALISYCRYLGKLFWPTDLAVYYPHPGHWPLGAVALAGALLLGISALVWMRRRRYPYLLVGWLWFLGTLVPVIGLVQVGAQAMADRYTYLPSLGVLILAVWSAYELTRDWRYQAVALPVAGGAVILFCLVCARQQLSYWKDSETLFRHALAVTKDNWAAHINLGNALGTKGQLDEAISHFQEALRLKPFQADACISLGVALDRKGQTEEAIRQFREALRLQPDRADVHYNLGNALAQRGQTDEAIRQFKEALRLESHNADTHNNLGMAFARQGQTDEAILQFQEALRLKPDNANAHNNLGVVRGRKGQVDEAISQYQLALRLKPDWAEAHFNLGNALGRKGQTDEAISQFQEALRLKPDYVEAHYGLGVALASKGQTDEAMRQYQEALRLKPDYAEARNNLRSLWLQNPEVLGTMASTLDAQGKYAEAIQFYRAALKAQPDQEEVLNNLAWLLATCPDAAFRNGPEAVRLAIRACQLTGYAQPLLIGTLAAAQAEAGDFPAAIATAQRAAALATQPGPGRGRGEEPGAAPALSPGPAVS